MKRDPYEWFQQPAEPLPSRQPLNVPPEEQPAPPKGSSDEQYLQESIQEIDEEANVRILHEVAQITAQSFASSQEAMRIALEVIGRLMECQTVFIARVEARTPEKTHETGNESVDEHVLTIIDARNRGTSVPSAGSEGPLNRTYCQTVWQTHQPLIVDDVRWHPFYQQLATTAEYNIGSYIGVPLVYSDGRVYGTLCSQDPRPRPLSEQPEKLEMMQIVARFLISHIEREELTTHLRAAEKAQAALARQEQLARTEADRRVRELEAVFEAIGDGLLVCDRNGHLQMNAAARHLLPLTLTQDDLLHVFEIQDGEALIRDEDGQPLAIEAWPIRRVLRGEHLIGTQVVNIQRVNARGEQRYLNVSGMPIYDQQEQVNGGVFVFRDLTERYLLEQRTQETLHALLTLAESLAWLPDNVPECFSIVPSDQPPSLRRAWERLRHLISTIVQCQDIGVIVLESETAKWHLPTESDPTYPGERSLRQEAIYLFASSQASDIDQLRRNKVVMHALRPQAGADAPMLVEAPMFLGNRLLGVLALIYCQHDVTLSPAEDALAKAVAKLTGLVHERERLLYEQAETRAHALALQEINRRFNEFLSIASHELRGPLTTFKGNIQLAQRTLRTISLYHAQEQEEMYSSLEKMQRYLERADHQIRIQDRLVSDLLDVSRISAGKLELHMQPCDVGQIVREIVKDHLQMTEERTINLALPLEKVIICGDADRLGQVVNNYLTNALKYSAADNPIEIAVTTDGESACVTVSDKGTGLTASEQKRIWERFYRAKGVHVLSGHNIGLGLGLHICKTIIEQHGGRVGLRSTPGKGSNFWFTLPLSSNITSC